MASANPTKKFTLPEFSNKMKVIKSKDKDGNETTMHIANHTASVEYMLGKPFDEVLYSRWGISEYEKNGKRDIELEVTPSIDDMLATLDKHVETTGKDLARSFFNKDKRRDYVPLVKANENGMRVLKVKVVCEGVDATEIYNNKKEKDTLNALNRDCECIVIATVKSIWFTTDQFGITLTAKAIIVKPGLKKPMGIEAFGLGDEWSWD